MEQKISESLDRAILPMLERFALNYRTDSKTELEKSQTDSYTKNFLDRPSLTKEQQDHYFQQYETMKTPKN